MESLDHNEKTTETVRSQPRRMSINKMLIFILMGATALIVFNGYLGDMRRKQNALAQAEIHVDRYAKRLGDAKILPLNHELDVKDEQIAKMFRMEWLSSNDARILRHTDQPVVVAQTVTLPLFLSADGRAVIFFDKGQYNIQWLTLAEFDQVHATQNTEIARIASSQSGH